MNSQIQLTGRVGESLEYDRTLLQLTDSLIKRIMEAPYLDDLTVTVRADVLSCQGCELGKWDNHCETF